MKKEDIAPGQKEQKKRKVIEKKLRKSERQLRDRLHAVQNAQGRATERLRRAEERTQKMTLRAKRLEERLIAVRQQLEGIREATYAAGDLVIIPPPQVPREGVVVAVEIAEKIVQFPVQDVQSNAVNPTGEPTNEMATPTESMQDEQQGQQAMNAQTAEDPAREARSAVEATEQETRAAVERAKEISNPDSAVAHQENDAVPSGEEHGGYPTPEEFARVEEITLAEENIEIAASMSTADAAGAAAATAEAIAEASSARTNEARLVAQQAEHFLEQVRNAVRDGVMQGEEAEGALRAAESETTYAHALLADAEAAEERARNDAMNAEAEAEVAEGMLRSANSHSEDTLAHFEHEHADHSNDVTTDPRHQDEAIARWKEDEDGNDTDELPAIRVQEHE